MTKPKAQTLQQKLGFFDEDLKKPKHDEIMIWLDQNIASIVNDQFYKPFDSNETIELQKRFETIVLNLINRFEEEISNLNKELLAPIDSGSSFPSQEKKSHGEIELRINELKKKIKYLQTIKFPDKIEKPLIDKVIKKWEYPVFTNKSSSNKYAIGFIDFAATFYLPSLRLNGFRFYQNDSPPFERIYFDIENDVFVDFDFKSNEKTIYIEVKTEISSLGELIRQINTYRSYLPGDYYVVCPDTSYTDILKAQNIGFIEYKKI